MGERCAARLGLLRAHTLLARVAARVARPLAATVRQAGWLPRRLGCLPPSSGTGGCAADLGGGVLEKRMTLSATKIQTKEPEQGSLAESGFSHRRLPTSRFTLDGGTELENHLARTCRQVLAGVQSIMPAEKLEAILLGGGYGRGEGGVLKTESGDRPYNDLEFYVCLRGNVWLNEQRFGRVIHAFAEELSPEAGVEVELKLF